MTLKDLLINLSVVGAVGTGAWYLKPTTRPPRKVPSAVGSVIPGGAGVAPEAASQEAPRPIQPDPRQGPSREADEKASRLKEARTIVWEMSNADAKAEAMIRKANTMANPAYTGNKQAIAEVRNGWPEALQACDKALELAEAIGTNALFDASASEYARAYKALTDRRKDIRDAQFRVLDYIEGLQPGELNRPGTAVNEAQRLFLEFGKKTDETRKAQGQAFRILNSLKLREN